MKNIPRSICHIVLLVSWILIIPTRASGQNTFEFVQDGVNNSYRPPVAKGPTSIPQTLSFFFNKDGSINEGIYFHPLKNPVAVTFSFEDQVYLNVPQHITGMTFGAASGASKNHVKAASVVNTAYMFNDSARTMFTAHPQGQPGKGINLFMNPGIQIFLSAKPLIAKGAPTSDTSRYYYGKLRLKFSRPVTDPVLTLVGLGATTNFSGQKLGFTTELELQTSTLTVARLSGTPELIVDQATGKILHDKSPISGTCGGGAACGSILVHGKQITTIVFNVYIRPDGGPGKWGTEQTTNSGDMWHLTVSMPEQ